MPNDLVKAKPVLILTSTLQPHSGVAVMIHDERVRLRQYRQALRWWKTNSPWPVVFADNSGSRLLTELNSEASDRCTLLAVRIPPAFLVASKGKGVGEALILRDAMERIHSDFNVIVKVTGRLTVRNITNCFSALEGRFLTCKITPTLDFSDSRVFAGDRTSIQYLADRIVQKSDEQNERYFEHELAAGALHLFSQGVPFRAFHRLPAIRGMSGTSGKSYDSPWHQPARWAHDGVRHFTSSQHLSL